jgi:hypothetical protein
MADEEANDRREKEGAKGEGEVIMAETMGEIEIEIEIESFAFND